MWVNGFPIEVKSQKLDFTNAKDFRSDLLKIDETYKWDKKDRKPIAFVFVSQETGAMLWLDTKETLELWGKAKVYDRQKKRDCVSYVLHNPKDHLKAMGILVAHILHLQRTKEISNVL